MSEDDQTPSEHTKPDRLHDALMIPAKLWVVGWILVYLSLCISAPGSRNPEAVPFNYSLLGQPAGRDQAHQVAAQRDDPGVHEVDFTPGGSP